MRVKLEEVCKRIYAGGDVPKNSCSKVKTLKYSVPIYTNGELNNGLYGYTDLPKENELSITIAARGTIGFTAIRKEPFFPAIRLITVVPDLSKVSVRYMLYALKKCKPKSNGTSISQLTVPDIKKTYIDIYNMPEQEKIADKLELITRIIDSHECELNNLDKLIKARFVEMFEKNEWSKTPLIKVIKQGTGISYGIVVPGDNVSDGVPMVRPSDFKNGSLDLSNVYRVTQSVEQKYSKTRLNGDEILIQVIGQPGQVMLATKECKGMNVTRNLAVIHADSEILNREYLKQYIEKEEIQHLLFKNTNQSTLKQLPLSSLKQLEVQLPPIKLQNQFADFVKQVDKSKLAVQQSLEKTQQLFDSLMQEYFG